MEHNELTTYIDAFLEGTLSEEEQQEFVNKRENDPEFKLAVEAQIKLKETVQRNELKKKLMEFETSFLPDKTSLIDLYLNNELSEELTVYVNSKLNDDEDFAQEVKAQEQVVAAIKRQQLKEQLQQFESQNEQKEPVFKVEKPKEEKKETKLVTFTPKTISLAASVLIILFVSIFYLNPSSEQKVIAQYKVVVEQQSEGLGFAGDENGEMSVEVIVDGKHAFHYQLDSKKLLLFVEEGNPIKDLKVVYNPASTPPYLIIIDGDKYFVDLSDSPTELKK